MMMPLKAVDVQPKVGRAFDKQEFAARRGRHLSPVDDRLSLPMNRTASHYVAIRRPTQHLMPWLAELVNPGRSNRSSQATGRILPRRDVYRADRPGGVKRRREQNIDIRVIQVLLETTTNCPRTAD